MSRCSLVSLDSTTHISDRQFQEGGMHSQTLVFEDWVKETRQDYLRRHEFWKDKIKIYLIFVLGMGLFD